MTAALRGSWCAPILVATLACHQPRQMAPQVPLEGIDGKYTFTISNPFKMEGQLLVAQSKAHMMSPRRCVPVEGPKSSDELRASWFECVAGPEGRPSGASLRLRFSEVDPINHSRWYQRTIVVDTVDRCRQYLNGRCVRGTRSFRRRWADRNGSITVVRGWPASVDTSRVQEQPGRGQLRIRCDTSAVTSTCGAPPRPEDQ